MRRQDAIEREAVTGDAGQQREEEKPEGPAVKPPSIEHAEHDDKAGRDSGEADHDMHDRVEPQAEQTEDHGNAPDGLSAPMSQKLSSGDRRCPTRAPAPACQRGVTEWAVTGTEHPAFACYAASRWTDRPGAGYE